MLEKEIDKYLTKYGFGDFNLKAVLFDMDGVLFDSMPYHAKAWAQVCGEYGLPIEPSEPYLHEGRTGASTIDIFANRFWGRNATDKEKSDIYARKCEVFNAFPEAPRMPGAETLLSKLKAQGLTIAVVTGSGQESLLSRLTTGITVFSIRTLLCRAMIRRAANRLPTHISKGWTNAA